jgi:NADPH-dependent 2,4-dienoyl-CoA reductase/sulfur reductase-like enzyme
VLDDVVVIGASLAGLRAVETFRIEGYDGRLTLVGAEPHHPYDRPPLSKRLLGGELEPSRILLRQAHEYDDLAVDLRLGTRATGLDVDRRVVSLGHGNEIPYQALVIATGAAPRRLPGQPDLPGLHVLRTLDDSLALRADLVAGPRRLVVIGAGFIGLEVAATARRLGIDVTVLEALPEALVRGLGAQMGEAVVAVHRAQGVDVRLGVGVEGFEGTERVEGVRLAGGEVLDADVVLVGIGVAPATGWLEASGLTLGDGVVCDPTLAAGPPGVYAAGDVVRWPHGLLGEVVRIEHWTNAAEQGAAAARNALVTAAGGEGTPYSAVPFFWSDQFDARIQFLGRVDAGDRAEVVSGSIEEGRFVALYERAGRLQGVLGLSLPRVVMPYRKLLAEGVSWEEARAHAGVN